MTDRPEPDAEPGPDADLIAYLDGELDAPEAQAVEARLALDPAARDTAEAYKKSFDLLDYLPRPEPSPDFATRTLLLATSDERRATRQNEKGTGKGVRPRLLSSLVARRSSLWILAAAVGGYATHAALRPYVDPVRDAEPLALDDLRVIENLPLYLGADDLDFVRQLDDPDLFAPDPVVPTPRPTDPPRAEGPPAGRDKLIALFKSYPPARQRQLREMDQDLHTLPPVERDRLTRVLEGYAVWLDRVPEADRREVLSAGSPADRLDVVRKVRERWWRDNLPAQAKELLRNAAGDDQQQLRLIQGWKQADRARRDEWALARRQWEVLLDANRKPWPFSDDGLSRQADEYVRTVLRGEPVVRADGRPEFPPNSRLTREEFAELRLRQEAAGRLGGWDWFRYGAYLYRLAEKHPSLPEPGKRPPLTEPNQAEYKEMFKALRQKGLAVPADKKTVVGRWPEFALAVDQTLRKTDWVPGDALGPCRPGEYTPAVTAFLESTLDPKLSPDERSGLKKVEGTWPEHPREVLKLAEKHDLPVPGVTLPGPPSRWAEFYRLAK